MGPLIPAGAEIGYVAFTVIMAAGFIAGAISLVVIARQLIVLARIIRHK